MRIAGKYEIGGKYEDRRLQSKERINVLFVMAFLTRYERDM